MNQTPIKLVLITSLIAIILLSGCLDQTIYVGESENGGENDESGSDITGGATKELQTATVTRVIDGDTVEIATTESATGELATGVRIRLVCIDAPETGQLHAAEAKERLEELVLDKEVKLEPDETDKDKYGRTLRYVWVDGKLASAVLIEEGLAKSYHYPPDLKYCDIMDAAQELARSKRRGIWENWDPDDPPTPCEELGCPADTDYVGSTESDKYHECTCRWAKKIAPHNLNCFDSAGEAKEAGYVACGVCEP